MLADISVLEVRWVVCFDAPRSRIGARWAWLNGAEWQRVRYARARRAHVVLVSSDATRSNQHTAFAHKCGVRRCLRLRRAKR